MRRGSRRAWGRLLLLVVLLALTVSGVELARFFLPHSLPAPGLTVIVARGSSADSVFQRLRQDPELRAAWGFPWFWRLLGHPPLQAGYYHFRGRISDAHILNALREGRAVPLTLTIVPGMSLQQLYARLAQSPYLQRDLPQPQDLAKALGPLFMSADSAEGLFMPQSYRYVPGDTEMSLLRRAAALMQSNLTQQWRGRAPNLPLHSPYQALILASIVQKEGAPLDQERRIAAVFLNRLRIGMPLQSDPTVIYALGKAYHKPLRPHDLRLASPYNTYLHQGLPPSPIAMPGLQALEAVLHPAGGDDLYFIASANGYHYSQGYAAHIQQIHQYLMPREKP